MTAGIFRFVRATQSQIDQCERLEWPHWGKALNWESFKLRETIIRDLIGQNIHFVLLDGQKPITAEVPKSLGFTEVDLPSWASHSKGKLVDPADVLDDEDGDSILAACQLFQRSATYKGKIYGYARALKEHLTRWLKESGTDFCCLYSEAGRFYEPEFTYMDTVQYHIPSQDVPLPSGVTLMKTLEHGIHLVNSDINLFSHNDCYRLIAAKKEEFVILPESHRYDFHFARERCQAYADKKWPLGFHGAYVACEDGEDSTLRPYITWHASFDEKKLWVLRLFDNGSRQSRLLLFRAALKIAHDAELVVVVGTTETIPEGFSEDFPSVTISDGNSSWPAMTYYNPELEGAAWTNRQRYAWS